MSNQSFYLYQLQKSDRRTDQIHSRLIQIKTLIGDQQVYIAANVKYSSSLSTLQEFTSTLASLEKKSTEKRLKMEISESSLYGGKVKNPKELTDLQQEIASLKSALKNLENEQLELMLLIEDQQLKVDQDKTLLDEILSKQESSNLTLFKENQALSAELERSAVERAALVQQLKSESLELYESLRKTKKGIAVAGVEDQCCTICGSQITPAEIQQAKSSSQIVRCSSCGRILYAD